MSELVLAAYANELKQVWATGIANENLITLLYSCVAEPLHLEDKNGELIAVDKTTASYIMNRKKGGNVRRDIRDHSSDDIVKKNAPAFFKKYVLPNLMKDSEDVIIYNLKNIIDGDPVIDDKTRELLLGKAKKSNIADFLAFCCLYVFTRKNVPSIKRSVKGQVGGQNSYKDHQLKQVKLPDLPAGFEKTYIEALLEIYNELNPSENINIDNIDSFPKYADHLSRQRLDYFAAESVRRGTRDMYGPNDPDQFEVLKSETYAGVIDTWEEDYKNGLTRFREVMRQAAIIPVDRCWLSRDTDWIGISQKKGVCHFLVNEHRLEGWIKKDDQCI